MNDDLVKRLRAEDPETGLRWSLASEAADRIEELEKALLEISDAVGDPSAYWIARAALKEGKYE